MRRNGLLSLLFIVALASGGMIATLVSGNEPLLGLDLQGGVSVVLQPAEEAEGDAIGQAIEIIRERIDALGVAEPEISRQGDAIVVQLPGVKDRDRALELVGQTAELRFRPVLQTLPGSLDDIDRSELTEEQLAALEGLDIELTPPEEDEAEERVILPQIDEDSGSEIARYELGPTAVTGDILSGARATLAGVGQWEVAVEVKGDRIDEFNQISGQCYSRSPTCPSGQLAIVLDSRVVSAPSINAPSFDPDRISISGSFTEGRAKDLALVLRYGALPVELVPQQTQSVSATLGKDALDAGIIAGAVGLALVTLYMLLYYRLLGMIAILSLTVSGALLWSVIAYLGESRGLALTLAGVTGIIVSIGVAVDSNVVFYEHLKEGVSNGRSMRTAVDSSFSSAFSTIVKADIASLIGAGILYWLTVGPVRGFAFYLGLSTILDLIASYFFMRPLALILIRSKGLQDRPRVFGLPVVEEVPS